MNQRATASQVKPGILRGGPPDKKTGITAPIACLPCLDASTGKRQ